VECATRAMGRSQSASQAHRDVAACCGTRRSRVMS
jgi:hypothetical protein